MAEILERQRRGQTVLLALVAVLVLAVLALWLARKPIAADLIDRELARRGVPASYQVKRIGLRTQRIEGVRIGDPTAPDLTAAWVEIDLRPTFGTPELVAIRAGGVRLRGRLVDGRVELGAVNRLLGAQKSQGFRLPDLLVGLTDARMDLATPAGTVSLRLDGRGNLANSFAGRYEALVPMLNIAGCRAEVLRMSGAVRTAAARPHLDGPWRALRLNCETGGARDLSGRINARLRPGLDGWSGVLALTTGPANAAGWTSAGMRGQVDFAGSTAQTAGSVRLAAIGLRGKPVRAVRAELGGRYSIESGRRERLDVATASRTALRFEGSLTMRGTDILAAPRLDGVAASLAATPIEALAASIARATADLSRGSDVVARLTAASLGSEATIRVSDLRLAGRSAVLRLSGGEGIRVAWPGRSGVQVDGRVSLAGSGIPSIEADVRQAAPGASLTGTARIAPYATAGSRVAFAPVSFAGSRFSTAIEASGPLLGGRVERARLPLTGSFGASGLRLNAACAPLSFDRLTVSGLVLDPAMLRLCPDGPALVAGGRIAGRVASPRLTGRIGSAPVVIDANAASFAGARFTIDSLDARIGPTRLAIARLTGVPDRGLAGRFEGASGQIGTVPLRVSNGSGSWRFAAGTLTTRGAVTVADTVDPTRFHPLRAADMALVIRGSDMRASGRLAEPETGTRILDVDLQHNLASGRGGADLRVDGLRFTPDGLQPERLTRLTLGVVADVDGSLSGTGRIGWSPDGITSSGRFGLNATALSAPFGPVTGVVTEIVFSDLLNMVSAPGQLATVKTINPGILVEDGVVRYRLVPSLKVAVEGARWPLAGGVLTLRPTELDFSEQAARRLTFDIAGLDAARFINQLEFGNLNATGIFDGTLPMVFDQDGGRIVDGRLAARAPGGTLAYNGEVSNADLGIWGGIAFDALKSIAYRDMTIALSGRIDGEMVSQIRFDGVSRGTVQPVATGLIARIGGRLASRLQQLPFRFNIRITAPFRGLLGMARSFYDPSVLIQDRIGPGLETTVQPPDSRDQR